MYNRVRLLVTIVASATITACATPPLRLDLAPTSQGVRVQYEVGDAPQAARLSERVAHASDLSIERDPSNPRRLTVEVSQGARLSMYPIAAKVGADDWFVYGPAVLPECADRPTVRLGQADGVSRPVDCVPGAYLVVRGDGDASRDVLFEGGSLVGAAIEDAAGRTMERLKARLGPSPASSPVIGIVRTQAAPSGIVAHVDRAGAVLFEVKPSFEAGLNPDVLRTQVRPLLRHELFHRWNMTGVAASDDVPVWFYEGAAEYVGGLMSLEEGDFAVAEYNWVLGAMLSRCAKAMGEKPLTGSDRGRVYDYDCGGVASWLLDLDLRPQGGDHYAFWKALISRAGRSGNGRYGWGDVEAVLRDNGWSAQTWRLFIGGGRPDRLVPAMKAAGAEVLYEGSASDYRIALLHPLLAANCSSSSYGFFDDPTGVALDVDSVCSVLPSQAKISQVAGVDILADARGAYSAARRICDGSETVSIVADGATVELRCATLEDPIASFQVLDAGLREGVREPV